MRALSNVVVSAVARVEVPAALWRKHRSAELDSAAASLLVAGFEWDWVGDGASAGAFAIVGVDDRILAGAARCVAVHALRAYDGVQLASALAARAADSDVSSFACFDERLRAAAGSEGFGLIP